MYIFPKYIYNLNIFKTQGCSLVICPEISSEKKMIIIFLNEISLFVDVPSLFIFLNVLIFIFNFNF